MFSGITNKIPIPKIYVNSNQTLKIGMGFSFSKTEWDFLFQKRNGIFFSKNGMGFSQNRNLKNSTKIYTGSYCMTVKHKLIKSEYGKGVKSC